ncbi:hypothetical protein HQ865_06285 [Mucilaginibacter mali]|uniref:Fibronectin type-III domain-containing protein n=1 Tax=Mucilaginibacter mali TaxID=2740462 RepID=A0A7D4UNV1_9SPHI|nr:hypothetical protein [Mucilaginibacter mali]QKJ29380.1 hypothetical protein HQ865_06285 [Mucilaginibacter mali]
MKNICLLFLALLFASSCGKKQSDSPPDPVPAVIVPGKSSLLLPAANAVCTTGSVVSNTQSVIDFSWTATDHTDSYTIVIKNLLTAATVQQNVTTNRTQATLDRNTPYSWYVTSTSLSASATTQSDISKFYNAGPAVVDYAPFPAELTAPAFAATISAGNINLTWKGSSTENDIAGYDVYLGTSSNPPLYKNNVTDMFLNNVPVTAGTQYYWRVATRDTQGNASTSDTYQFKTN